MFEYHTQDTTHKRHLETYDTFDTHHHPVKRRLVDHLNGLSLGFGNNKSRRKPLFGTYTPEQINASMNDPNKVIIRNIDQFLHENPDQLDLIGEKLQLNDLKKAGLDKLIISSGLDLKKAWNNILSQYKSNNKENKDINDIIYKLIWEDYLAKYFSLIKYYNPLKIVWDNYEKWLKKHYTSNQITELPHNEDLQYNQEQFQYEDSDMMMDDDEEELNRLAEREKYLRDNMSSYGSYYQYDDNYYDSLNFNNQQPIVEDVDDIIMED